MGEYLPADDLKGNFVFAIEEGVVSHAIRSPSGNLVDMGIGGPESIFPFAGLLGVSACSGAAMAQVDKVRARRIAIDDFRGVIGDCEECRSILNHWMYASMMQVYSTVVAAREADIVGQVARWLLMCHDRTVGDELQITHELLAQLCNAYRPTVTNALAKLRAKGAITCGRGRITILSRQALAAEAGPHYGQFEAYYRETIGPFGKAAPTPAHNDRLVAFSDLRALG
ncbi:Crp/Fnr family transcriptional regulator [Sphingomicrobium clamense]|uniref:Crp/Fnr family transcriptional regulator n=1 Tax=Sphingomicrobium clamense TaxID=2851013 RepID=A0ABS6V8A0_9SPHN|nr:Crp/Fnr family transcriptional regulator [Sphingomicrobium sp. B8]MBW0145798.1 Crp/Fnr family transcriptional regulator [Sphingomicrobium sp. B8]